MQLPLEVFCERWRLGQNLFEGRRVFLVLKLLRLVSRIEIVLKLTTEIDFFEGGARRFRCKFVTGFQARSFSVGINRKLCFAFWSERAFRFNLT